MIAGGLGGIAGAGWYLARALATGSVRGRLGAVHVMPEPAFLVGVGAGVFSIVMGSYLVRAGWRLLQGRS